MEIKFRWMKYVWIDWVWMQDKQRRSVAVERRVHSSWRHCWRTSVAYEARGRNVAATADTLEYQHAIQLQLVYAVDSASAFASPVLLWLA